MDSETTKIVIGIISAVVGAGIVITVSVKVSRKNSKKVVHLKQGGVTLNEINNTASIDQSDKT